MCPEIIEDKGHDFLADWWALGITLYELATGKLPFGSGGKDNEEGVEWLE